MMKRITVMIAAAALASAAIFYGISYFTAPAKFDPDKYLDKDFRSFTAELQAARNLYKQGKQDEAKQALQAILTNYKNRPTVAHSIAEPRFDLAQIYKDLGQPALAQQEYEAIIASTTDPTTLLRARLELGALKAAADDPALLDELYQQFKDTPEVCGKVALKYAEVLVQKQHFARAADILCQALGPGKISNNYLREQLTDLLDKSMTARAGRAESPLRAAEMYIEQVKKFPEMSDQCWLWLQSAGLLYQQEGHFARARNAFNRIIRDYPGESDSQANAGYELIKSLDAAERKAATPLTEAGVQARQAGGEQIEIVNDDIRQQTTWQPGKTYVVIGEVAVRKGSSLTIRPGARVEFALHSSLMVHGRLDAAGTHEQPIVFTSAAGDPSFFDWEGVRFGECTAGVIKNARIEYARKGIFCEDVVRDALVKQPAAVHLENIKITHCGFAGVESRYAAPDMVNLQIDNNDGYGMIFFKSMGSISGGSIAHCGRAGISIRKESEPAIVGMVIDSAGDSGIECFDESNATLANIVVSNSGKHGVQSIYSAPNISNSEISGSRQAGLFWSDGSKGTISDLKVELNNGGVYCTIASAPKISGCRFIANTSYGIKCEASNPEIIGNDFRRQQAAGILVLDICRPVVKNNTFGAGGIAVRHEGEYLLDLTANKWPEDTAVTKLIEVPEGADMQKLIRLIPQQ